MEWKKNKVLCRSVALGYTTIQCAAAWVVTCISCMGSSQKAQRRTSEGGTSLSHTKYIRIQPIEWPLQQSTWRCACQHLLHAPFGLRKGNRNANINIMIGLWFFSTIYQIVIFLKQPMWTNHILSSALIINCPVHMSHVIQSHSCDVKVTLAK